MPESRIAVREGGVTAMHDATEGGVLGAAWELAEASGLGLRLRPDTIPVRAVTRKLCAKLGLDPLRLISSGVMLIAHPDGNTLIERLREQRIEATAIGVFTAGMERLLVYDGHEEPLAPPDGDEIYEGLAP
jgi:hydrogenase maturation factor